MKVFTMPDIEIRLNTEALDRLIREIPGRADQVTAIAADLVVNDIRSHWSGHSPSAPGDSPAVASGELDASIVATKIAGGDRPTYQVTGTAGHAVFLEKGTRKMARRPFIYPAMQRMRSELAGVFKLLFKA